MGTRRFGSRQRVALYLAAGGVCAICQEPLSPGWHADHMKAWSRGGATDVVNGQALCPTCNLKKGTSVVTQSRAASESPRPWQQAASTHYEAVNKRYFLCCACPGAGKTKWTLALARRLLDDGTVRRVVVVAPSRSVRDQWKDQVVVDLEAVANENGGHENYTDFEGCTLTYAQVAINPDLQRMASHERPTLVIFDEIHHAGDEQAWGEKMLYAFEHATRIIGLTGTPWRRPKTGRIPFVTYGEKGQIQPDYEYSYGQAVTDVPPVCRVIQFHAYDAQVQCVELELGTSTSRSLSDLTDLQDRSQAMTAILDTKREWMRSMLEKGHVELASIRAGSVDDGAVPDAQGLVIADDQQHARDIARLLERITGEAPELIISDEPDAEAALIRFGRGSKKWAVAVNKVSEGVDVASLYVGVYATRKTSPLLFRQIAGRFVRRRGQTETRDAVLFIPAVPDLMVLASEIQNELRHAVELALDEQKRERKEWERPRDDGEPDLRVWQADDATLSGVIRGGEQYSPSEVHDAQQWANRLKAEGFSVDPIMIARLDRLRGPRTPTPADVATDPTSSTVQQAMTREERKRELKRKLDRAAKAAAIEMGKAFDEFNQNLVYRFKKPRSALSMEEMKQQITFIQDLVRQYREGM